MNNNTGQRTAFKSTAIFGTKPGVKVIRREQTPEEQFRRNALACVRAAVKMYPKDVIAIVHEMIPGQLPDVENFPLDTNTQLA